MERTVRKESLLRPKASGENVDMLTRRDRRRRGVAVWVALWLALGVVGGARGQEETLRYRVQEESEVGAFVGNVARDSQLYSRFSQAEFQQLHYSVSTQAAKFSIDENTSTIRTGQVLDRETECEFLPPSDPCEMDFDVGVYKWDQDTQLYDLLMIVHVTVVLEDINDNSPQFPNRQVSLSVPESVPVGHVLLTSGAIDTDTGPGNIIQEYRLLPDTPAFRLQVMTGVDGLSSDLGIVVERALDRERQAAYHLQVVASDGGFPQRSGTVNITIIVQDVNDNVPKLSQDVFNVTVAEDARTNVPILRLGATDPDSDNNGALTFAFSSRTSQKIRDQFAVDKATGDVILTKPLDFEKDRRLQFMAEVKDQGSPSQQAQAAVIVNVADVNDNAPQIDITLPPGGINIAESIEVGSFIAHVSLSDLDGGKNGEIRCSVTNEHFRLEKFSDFSYIYKILLQESLDYEEAKRHLVNVSCTDLGSPPRTNSSSFTINVRDENDNAPVFSEPEYHISVRENMDPGRYVFQVIATDFDAGTNGNLTYSLLENPESAFSIDRVSGVLRAMRTFDRETRPSYQLVVQAEDRGSPPLASSVLVQVEIDDENDNPTRFALPHFEFSVEEEQAGGAVVDRLRVRDLDDLATGRLHFSFLPDPPPPPQFVIIPNSGQINTTTRLDREGGDNVFDFRVFVVDAENFLFNDTATVKVTVTDVNDHAPNITFPTTTNNSVKLPYTVPAGTIVTKVMAHDLDRGENGSSGMTYSLESDNVKDMFLMNGINGELILTRRLHAGDVGTYKMRVSVQDSGHVVQMTTMASLEVTVTLSNTSGFLADAGGSDHNVAIVVTLVCVTVALALAVLATICIIRRIDRERKSHTQAKAAEQSIYKQETLPPGHREEKAAAMDSYESEMHKLKLKIQRELSFTGDEDTVDCSTSGHGTSTTFSTFRKTGSGSSIDPNGFSSPQASSSVLHAAVTSPEVSGIKRVHYLDSPEVCPVTSSAASSQPWSQHRPLHAGLTVRAEGEDCGSHTSGSTSDSGRGGSSEDDVHSHRGEAGEVQRLTSPRGYLGNPSLSTFRGPNPTRPLAGSQQQTGSDPSRHPQGYSRNISFSDDSVTANTTDDGPQGALPGHRSPAPGHDPTRRPPAASLSSLSDVTEEGGGVTSPLSTSLPRSILCKDRGEREGRYQNVASLTSPPPSSNPSPLTKSLPYRRHYNPQGQGGQGHHYQNQPYPHHRRSPPSLPSPPDVSALENHTGDDVYGVRGKVVSFSVGESYQMTPRGPSSSSNNVTSAGSPTSPSESAYSQPQRRQGQGRRPHDDLRSRSSGQGQSSLGHPYSLGDVDAGLGDEAPSGREDEDRTTTTSGSYTINADDLCHEIDNLFFNDVVV